MITALPRFIESFRSNKLNDLLKWLGLVPFFTQQLSDAELLHERLARVTVAQRSLIKVIGEWGERVVTISPAIRIGESADRPTVGDWVVLDASLARIEQVLERKSLFKRVGAGSDVGIQPIAANVDVLFIVTSCNDEFKESRLERYLTLCAEAGATPVIVLTKTDLSDDASVYVDRARSVQRGVSVETANALDASTLDGVRAWIEPATTVALVGSSGVGKSTLLNTLAGYALALTGDIRDQDKKGRHTTTHRELHILPDGGLLIDVPGMRELKVADIDHSIGVVFDDIEQLALQCQFSDCGHTQEPGCAVRRAIERDELDARRLVSYQKLQRENTLATATLAQKRERGRGFAKIVKQAKRIKQNKSRE